MEMKNILRFEEAKWNVSGLFSHDDILIYIYDIFRKRNIDIFYAVHGSTACLWNSGRAIRQHSPLYFSQCIEAYRERELPVFLTFSNYLIDKKMLEDEASNKLLDSISYSDRNGVILSSRILKDYIKSKYPHLKIYSSILNVVNQNGKGNPDFYRKVADEFNRVVLHPDDCFDLDFLESLENKNSYEVIVNENCVRNCPYRKKHEDMVCDFFRTGRSGESFDVMYKFTKENCRSLLDDNLLDAYVFGKLKSCNLSNDEISRIYSMGYRFFKLQGRNDSPGAFVYDITKYIFKKEVMAYIFKLIMNRISDTPYKESLKFYMQHKE